MPRTEHRGENQRHHQPRHHAPGPSAFQQKLHPVRHPAAVRLLIEKMAVMPNRERRMDRGVHQSPWKIHPLPESGPADRQAELRRPNPENPALPRGPFAFHRLHPQRGRRDFHDVLRVFMEPEKLFRGRGNHHRSLEDHRARGRKLRLTSRVHRQVYRPLTARVRDFPCCQSAGRLLLTIQPN